MFYFGLSHLNVPDRYARHKYHRKFAIYLHLMGVIYHILIMAIHVLYFCNKHYVFNKHNFTLIMSCIHNSIFRSDTIFVSLTYFNFELIIESIGH